MSRPSAPVFQVQGAAKEEDVTEEDGSEERSAERVEEGSYVRDKETAPLMKPLSRVSFTSAPMTHILCTSFSKYISSQHHIHSTIVTIIRYIF